MKKWLLAGGGLTVAAILAMVVTWPQESSSVTDEEGATQAVAPSPQGEEAKGRVLPPVDPEDQKNVQRSIDELLAEDTSAAWSQIVGLYKGADEETKRKILTRAAQLPELEAALGTVLATVGDDYALPEEDRMIDEAAQLLKERWQEPGDVKFGRTMLLAQKTDKRRLVMAKALVTFAKDVGEGSPFHSQKMTLEAKLIDVHSQVRDGFVKAEIVHGIRELGNRDVALVLAKGANMDLSELEFVQTEGAEQQALLEQLAARDKARGEGERRAKEAQEAAMDDPGAVADEEADFAEE